MAVAWSKLAKETDVITKSIMTAQGDILYASAASTPAVLAAGDAGDVLTSGGAGANPSWEAPSGGSVDYQQFTSSGTWTKPAGCTMVLVDVIGGGAAGNNGGTSSRGRGGKGGGGGARCKLFLPASLTGDTETVTVGSSSTSNGNYSSFGSLVRASGGSQTSYGGSIGTTSPVLTSAIDHGGSVGSPLETAGTSGMPGRSSEWGGGAGGIVGTLSTSSTNYTGGKSIWGGGGGGAGGSTYDGADGYGGAGGGVLDWGSGGGGNGGNPNGSNGSDGDLNQCGAGGGGGRGYSTSTNGGNGGNGGTPGGGGGGGGASANGNGGTRGSGARGEVRVWAW